MKSLLIALGMLAVISAAHAQKQISPPKESDWLKRIDAFYLAEKKDPFSDARIVAAFTPSHEHDLDVALAWRCSPGKDVALTFLGQILIGDWVANGSPLTFEVIPVRWRLTRNRLR